LENVDDIPILIEFIAFYLFAHQDPILNRVNLKIYKFRNKTN